MDKKTATALSDRLVSADDLQRKIENLQGQVVSLKEVIESGYAVNITIESSVAARPIQFASASGLACFHPKEFKVVLQSLLRVAKLKLKNLKAEYTDL